MNSEHDASEPLTVGLRVDVDTFSGTRVGVPELLCQLDRHGIQATFYFTMGPDNMGRHVLRLLKPAFLAKMWRSKASSLYGWDILLRGTFGPGPVISGRLGGTLTSVATAGHEVGLHAWDHHLWQSAIDTMPAKRIARQLKLGTDAFVGVFDRPAASSAAAGWKCTNAALLEKERFGFRFNSDCRGDTVFRPQIAGRSCAPQIPVTLPTYDELIGLEGITDRNYNEHLLSLLERGRLNVLAIHAEVEGMARAGLFAHFLELARDQGASFVPLGTLVPDEHEIPDDTIVQGRIAGREGLACWQASAIRARAVGKAGAPPPDTLALGR